MRKLSALLIAIMFLFSFGGLAWAVWEGPGGECNELNCGRPSPPNTDDMTEDMIDRAGDVLPYEILYGKLPIIAVEKNPVF